MRRDVFPFSTRLAVPSLLLALVGGTLGLLVPSLQLLGFALLLAGLAGAFWSVSSLFRAHMFQSARLTRMERRVSAAKLEGDQTRQTFDELIEGLRVMLFVVDSKLTIVAANKAARKAFEFPEPVGESLVGVTHSHALEELVKLAAASRPGVPLAVGRLEAAQAGDRAAGLRRERLSRAEDTDDDDPSDGGDSA
jgi:PAS domain-containing protein